MVNANINATIDNAMMEEPDSLGFELTVVTLPAVTVLAEVTLALVMARGLVVNRLVVILELVTAPLVPDIDPDVIAFVLRSG